MAFPATLSLISNVFTQRRERARAIGLWGAIAGVAIAMGPIVGGWLLEQFSWASIFIAMAPVAAAAAAATLIGQGDHGLALQIIQPGLLRHPASITLAGLRATALHRLMEQYQQLDPFKFLIYAELAGAEIGPVQ